MAKAIGLTSRKAAPLRRISQRSPHRLELRQRHIVSHRIENDFQLHANAEVLWLSLNFDDLRRHLRPLGEFDDRRDVRRLSNESGVGRLMHYGEREHVSSIFNHLLGIVNFNAWW